MFRDVFQRALNKWLIEDLLRVTLTPDDYQTKLGQTQPKYIFIKPESLCYADPRWQIHCQELQPTYVSPLENNSVT